MKRTLTSRPVASLGSTVIASSTFWGWKRKRWLGQISTLCILNLVLEISNKDILYSTWNYPQYLFKKNFIYLFVYWLRGTRDLSSPIRDRTHAPCIGSTESQSLNHQGKSHIPSQSNYKIPSIL